MRIKTVKLNGKNYNLTIDAMLIFECQQILKINLLEKLSKLAELDETEQAKATCELWPVTALSLTRYKENGYKGWQEALSTISISEIQDLTLELVNSIGETNVKN